MSSRVLGMLPIGSVGIGMGRTLPVLRRGPDGRGPDVQPVLAYEADEAARPGRDRAPRLQLELRLTSEGERVLRGEADRVELMGVDRWLGGTHVTTPPARRSVSRCQAPRCLARPPGPASWNHVGGSSWATPGAEALVEGCGVGSPGQWPPGRRRRQPP